MAAKHPEPFWRKQTNCYYVQIGPKQIRLAKDKAEAYRLHHELMARKPDEPQPSPQPTTLAAVSLIDEFVEWTRVNRERPTFDAYKRRLGYLVAAIPSTPPCMDLRPYHLTRVMDAKGWNPTTKNDFATAAIRV